jgi:nicotinate phosphoribosyltransferase
VREPGGEWEPRIKISDQSEKVSNPGIQQVRRFYESHDAHSLAIGDAIYDTSTDPTARRCAKAAPSSTRATRFVAKPSNRVLTAKICWCR